EKSDVRRSIIGRKLRGLAEPHLPSTVNDMRQAMRRKSSRRPTSVDWVLLATRVLDFARAVIMLIDSLQMNESPGAWPGAFRLESMSRACRVEPPLVCVTR